MAHGSSSVVVPGEVSTARGGRGEIIPSSRKRGKRGVRACVRLGSAHGGSGLWWAEQGCGEECVGAPLAGSARGCGWSHSRHRGWGQLLPAGVGAVGPTRFLTCPRPVLSLPCSPQTPSSHSLYSPTATRSVALTCTGVTTACWSLGCATPSPWTSTSTRAHCTGLMWWRTRSTGESCSRMGVCSPWGGRTAWLHGPGGWKEKQACVSGVGSQWCSCGSPQPL